MLGKIIVLGAKVLVYYKSAEVTCKIVKNAVKLFRMFGKNTPEGEVIETHFAD